jgi:hypothetical protein
MQIERNGDIFGRAGAAVLRGEFFAPRHVKRPKFILTRAGVVARPSGPRIIYAQDRVCFRTKM